MGVDEILRSATNIVSGLVVNEAKIQENLERYAPFSATEEVIIEAVKNGADRQEMHEILKKRLVSKGFKGAVGTQASYKKLMGEKVSDFENQLMDKLGLKAALIAGQTTPRKMDYFISSVLSGIAQSLYKFAFDLRVLQSPNFGELSEPFGKTQVGSSAMPFKRNPVKSENICSLAKLVLSLADNSAQNASLSLLERISWRSFWGNLLLRLRNIRIFRVWLIRICSRRSRRLWGIGLRCMRRIWFGIWEH